MESSTNGINNTQDQTNTRSINGVQNNNPSGFILNVREKYKLIDNKTIEIELLPIEKNTNNINEFKELFMDVLDVKVDVENGKNEIRNLSVRNVLDTHIQQMQLVNKGLIYTWIHNGKKCHAILDRNGIWTLYLIVYTKNVCDICPPRSVLIYEDLIFNKWGNDQCMYRFTLINPINLILTIKSSLESDIIPVEARFRYLSYCERYLNIIAEEFNI
jgi:hypothetical protein